MRTYYDGLRNSAITISGNTIEYSVTNANGHLLEYINHKGTKTTCEDNSVGVKLKQTNPDGSTVVWTYNQVGQNLTETQQVEDTNDMLTHLVTSFTYNGVGEVIHQKLEAKVLDKASSQNDTYLLKETNLTYDELGRLVRERSKHVQEGTTTFKTSDIRLLYDLNGNLLRKWVYDETSQTNVESTIYPFVRSESRYEYDDNNRMISEIKVENGQETLIQYNDDENAEVIDSALGIKTIIKSWFCTVLFSWFLLKQKPRIKKMQGRSASNFHFSKTNMFQRPIR